MGIKVLFMGTPDFAVPVLKALIENFEVVAVVTKADKPKGRGKQIVSPPVKIEAEKHGIPVLQPESVKNGEFASSLSAYNADFFVTAAYGKILPERVLRIPSMGCVNVHASILPYYRGAAPIWRAVLNGEHESGVTTMLTDAGMDTGDILLCERVKIGENMTTGELHDSLSRLGAKLIVETLNGLARGEITPVPQENDKATYAPMVDREVGRINWNSSSEHVHNTVRGCDPFPGAFSYLNGEKIKIWRTKLCVEECNTAEPGTVLYAGEDGIVVRTGSGAIRILELQAESSKRMTVKAYLNGHAVNAESVFESTERTV